MAGMNKAILIGWIASDIKLVKDALHSEARFEFVANERKNGGECNAQMTVVCRDGLAEVVHRMMEYRSRVYVTGAIQPEQDESGAVLDHIIVADDVGFMDDKFNEIKNKKLSAYRSEVNPSSVAQQGDKGIG